MPAIHDLFGILSERQGQRQVRLYRGANALLPRREWRPAELYHWRRFAVGDGRQDGGGIQRYRQILHLPVGYRPPGLSARGVRISADHQGGIRKDQGLGLLQGYPDPRGPAQGADQQGANREFARPALRRYGTNA